MPLSPNKTLYLQKQSSDEIYLTLEQVTELAHYLSEKHQFAIYVKGDLQTHSIEIKPELLACKHISFEEALTQQTDESGDEDDMSLADFDATKEALLDMLSIQHKLTDGQTVGYIYTYETRGRGHFECFIIRQNEIIKPQLWYVPPFADINPNVLAEQVCFSPWANLSVSKLEAFKQATTVRESIAQADGSSCGSLCLATLKNLLKNDAQQLNDLTLQVPWLNHQNKIEYFFLASPQVLKYSQVSSYNASMQALLLPEVEGEEIYLIKHLMGLIESLKDRTEPEGFIGAYELAIDRARHLLQILPEFAKRWLSLFDLSMAKRQLMSKRYNEYLSYTAHRYWVKSNHLYYDKELNLGDFVGLSEHYKTIANSQDDYFERMYILIGPGDEKKAAYLLAKLSATKPDLAAVIALVMLPKTPFIRSAIRHADQLKQWIKNSFNELTCVCSASQKSLIIEHVKILLPSIIHRFFKNKEILDSWFIICDLTSDEIKNYLEKNNALHNFMTKRRETRALSSWLDVLSHYAYLTENSELPIRCYISLYRNLISEFSETKIEILNKLLGAFTTSSLAQFFNAFPQLNPFLIDASVDLFFKKSVLSFMVSNKEELMKLWQAMGLFVKCSENENLGLVQMKLSILLEPFVNFDLRLKFLNFLIGTMTKEQNNSFFMRVFPEPIHQAGLRLTYFFPYDDKSFCDSDNHNNQSDAPQTKKVKIG